jgi:hypothetical protein
VTLPRLVWSSLVLVASVHLLTTPAVLVVTDHVEMMFTAERLVSAGTLDLTDGPKASLPALPWVVGRPGMPLRTRHLPMTAITLAPLVALDHAVGHHPSGGLGPFTRLHGHLFVLGGLILLAQAILRSGAGSKAAAMAVALTGLAWPVWRASCAPSPEALLVFWLALYLWGTTLRGAPRTLTCVLALVALPWSHASGMILATALAVAELLLIGREEGLMPALPAVAGAAAGIASVLIVWNHLYHGDWWTGGYALYRPVDFLAADVVAELWAYVTRGLLDAPAVPIVLVGALLSRIAFSRAPMTRALVTTLALIALLVRIVPAEPDRRLAPLWPLWALVAAAVWQRLGWRRPITQALIALQGLVGFHRFWSLFGRHLPGPRGLFYPNVLWVRWAIDGRAAMAAAAVSVLLVALCLAALRVSRGLR